MSENTNPPTENALAFVTNRWSRRFVQPLLIGLMVTAVFTAVCVLLFILTGDGAWLVMPLLCFVLVLEGVYTTLWLQHPNQRITDNLAYRAAEVVVIVLICRLFTWVIGGDLPDWRLYEEYLRRPFALFSGMLFVVGTPLILAAWSQAINTMGIFTELAVDEGEAVYFLTPKRERDDDARPFQLDRSRLVVDFFRQWVAGGVLLVLLAAMSTFDLPQLEDWNNILQLARMGMMPHMLTALLVYFISGFLLLSQARLAAINGRWLHDGVMKSHTVERNWHRYSLRLLLVVALIASFLPLGDTTGIGRLLEIILFVLGAIFSLLSFLFLGLLAALIPNAQQEAGEATPTPEIFPTVPSMTPVPPSEAAETAELVFSSAFWAVAIVLSVVAISFFLRERGVRLNTTLLRQIWAALSAWLAQVWRAARAQATELRQAAQARLQLIREKPEEQEEEKKRPFRFIRVNALPPREQIRYFYLSTLQRAEERGVPRRADETPLEFARDLKEEFPDAEIDVEELTGAFLKARYSPQPIEKEDVGPVKKRWKEMRSRLRTGRRGRNQVTEE